MTVPAAEKHQLLSSDQSASTACTAGGRKFPIMVCGKAPPRQTLRDGGFICALPIIWFAGQYEYTYISYSNARMNHLECIPLMAEALLPQYHAVLVHIRDHFQPGAIGIMFIPLNGIPA